MYIRSLSSCWSWILCGCASICALHHGTVQCDKFLNRRPEQYSTRHLTHCCCFCIPLGLGCVVCGRPFLILPVSPLFFFLRQKATAGFCCFRYQAPFSAGLWWARGCHFPVDMLCQAAMGLGLVTALGLGVAPMGESSVDPNEMDLG